MKKTISVCAYCGKKRCDGALWKVIACDPVSRSYIGHETCSSDLFIVTKCSKHEGNPTQEDVLSAKVGDILSRHWPNWTKPVTVTYLKISDE